jgi:hypothetical protein
MLCLFCGFVEIAKVINFDRGSLYLFETRFTVSHYPFPIVVVSA